MSGTSIIAKFSMSLMLAKIIMYVCLLDTTPSCEKNGDDLAAHFVLASSIGAGLAFLTSLSVQDGGPHDVRSKMAAPTKSRWRPL